MSPSLQLPHIAFFPFMSKGHTIPLLHLAHLLHRSRLATLTFFTTPLNAPFIRRSLTNTNTNTTIIELPFPQHPPDIPNGVESTDSLPSISLFLPFINAVKRLQPHFEESLKSIPTPSFLISDGFLGWTRESAAKFGIPRVVFYGMGGFAMSVSSVVALHRPHSGVNSHDEPFKVPGFPNLELTKADLSPPFDDPDPHGPHHDFIVEQGKATIESRGIMVNTFYQMEAAYLDRWSNDFGAKYWAVGPLCLAQQKAELRLCERPSWMEWLDSRSAMARPVLYVAFGTQAEVSVPQLQEIATGLENSMVDFLWVVRRDGIEGSVGERGMVVREWVDQMEILRHESVKGFMSHCGWNSVLEAVSEGVPILTMPMMAEQYLNAKFVVEVLGIGVRVRASDGTRDGLVKAKDIEEMARELVVGEKGKRAAEKVKEWTDAARKAMDDGGSSCRALEAMIDEVCKERTTPSLD